MIDNFYWNLLVGHPRIDLLVFHTTALHLGHRSAMLAAAPGANVTFLQIEWHAPAGTAETVKAFSVGYRNMIRFFASQFVLHPVVASYAYYLRLDTDSRFIAPVVQNPFTYAAIHGIVYGFVMILYESPAYYADAWRRIRRVFEPPVSRELYELLLVQNATPPTVYGGVLFYNNFELATTALFRSVHARAAFAMVDASNVIYTHRLGDHVLHTLYVCSQLKASDLHYYHDIAYSHKQPSEYSAPREYAGYKTRFSPCPSYFRHRFCALPWG